MAATTSQPVGNPNVDKPLRDLRQEVTDSIVEMLERGVAPWQKPWEPGRVRLRCPSIPPAKEHTVAVMRSI